jgi:hypothetical protein
VLDELKGSDGTWKYENSKLRLYRYVQNGWQEYSEAQKDNFRFVPGRVQGLMTRISLVGPLYFGNGHTVPVKAASAIVLAATGWTDICLPYRFNIRVGDILLKTNLTGAESNGLSFYEWGINQSDAKKRYFTSGVFLPTVAGMRDSTYELTYGSGHAYAVYNSLSRAVTLQIPPTPVVYSQVVGKKRMIEKGWSVAIVPETGDGALLSPVYCGYSGEGVKGIETTPLSPSWSAVSVGVYDRGRGKVCGSLVAGAVEEGGGNSFELVFENGEGGEAAITYRVERLSGQWCGMQTQVVVLNPLTGEVEAVEGTGALSVKVGGYGRESRWLVVGSVGYIAGYSRRLTGMEFGLSRIMPNPFRGKLRIGYTVPMSGIGSVGVEAVDQLGRLLWSTKIGGRELHAGRNEVQWNPGSGRTRCAAGVYIIRLTGYDVKGRIAGRKQTRVIYLP